MIRYIEIEGRKALGFDTGLDSRAFAQSKFAQFITEPGFLVSSSGQIEQWKASGVRELNNADGKPTMIVWGPLVAGERFDQLLNNAPQDKILAAISAWVQALVALQENFPQAKVPLWPCAAMIEPEAETYRFFFAPPTLIQRGMAVAGEEVLFFGGEWYVHPDLGGADAIAFSAAAMLYRAFAGTAPFSADNESLLHQDMREGNFLPVRLAVPGLNARLAALIQNALVPADKKKVSIKSAALLDEIIAILKNGIQAAQTLALIQPLSETDNLALEKEKAQYLKISTASVNTRRFVMRNTARILGIGAVVAALTIVVATTIHSHANRPNTAGMEPVQVIESFYNAFGDMDHQLMEGCVTRGTAKDDINMVVNLFVINKVRQTHELSAPPLLVSASEWQRGAIEVIPPAQVFGVTDLSIAWLAIDESSDEVRARADYIIWLPIVAADNDGFDAEIVDRSSQPHPRSDVLTLTRKRGNWRISALQR